ncbi:hypothetical protein Hte_009413 [Hypoxylon texense]
MAAAQQQGSSSAAPSPPLLLDRYIRRATGTGTSSNNNGNAADPRSTIVLDPHRTNYILLYNGCFNPPHRGHLAHLTHAYRHGGGGDMHIVGAVVLVAGDEYLRWKLGSLTSSSIYSPTFRLPEAQRTRLWTEELAATTTTTTTTTTGDGENGAGAWTWVLRENRWLGVSDSLKGMFRRDRLKVEFVRLAGGDKAGVDKVQHGVWGCRTTLTTDVCRPVDFYFDGDDGYDGRGGGIYSPKLLANHGPWKFVQIASQETGPEEEEGRAKVAAPAASLAVPSGSRNIWECYRGARPGSPGRQHTLRFVSSTAAERLPPDLSSTELRALIAAEAKAEKKKRRPHPHPHPHPMPIGPPTFTHQHQHQQFEQRLEQALRPVALSPTLLAWYVVEAMVKEEK